MVRVVLVLLSVICFLLGSEAPLLLAEKIFYRKNPERLQAFCLGAVQGMFRLILRISGVTISVRGRENIPDRAVLYVGNHRSYFDILVGYVTVPGLTGFVAKKEMLVIPFLKDWMRCVNCLFLDRENIRAGLKTILAGIEKVKGGVSIWIFPEGHRSRGANPLDMLPFKDGSLKIAEKAGCPVVPVAITGTPEILEQHIPFIRPSRVIIEYGEPFYIKELSPADRKRAGAYTQDRIRAMLERQLKERETWK